MLVIGGQAKSSEVGRGKYRQLGFQEIDGESLCKSITKFSKRIEERMSKTDLFEAALESWSGRKGPVFLEICLDVSTQPGDMALEANFIKTTATLVSPMTTELQLIIRELLSAERPIILIGGGVHRSTSLQAFIDLGIPIATTYNGTDRIGCDYEYYAGRPNWYGSRWANILIQQSDLILAFGTRLGIAQVGYNWQEFAPKAKIVQIDIDEIELNKGFPRLFSAIRADANDTILRTSKLLRTAKLEIQEWQEFTKHVRAGLSGPEATNTVNPPFLEAMNFVKSVVDLSSEEDLLIPCSSGAAAYEGAMRVLMNKTGQIVITSHALASMGYGLSGAIGASLAHLQARTILFEGDGGFAQNLQELGTLRANKLNLKIFLMDNQGYQSIRGNQKNAFDSHYVGCDRDTGLFLPDWQLIAESFEIASMELNSETFQSSEFNSLFDGNGPALFVVKIDPNQTYWPRLLSRKLENGQIVSNPLHLMEPPLVIEIQEKYIKYL